MKIKHLLPALLTVLLFAGSAAAQTDSTFHIRGALGNLAARLQLPTLAKAEKCPLVILCHGFSGNMGGKLFDDITADLNKEGIGVLRFDFNGHGKSEGRFQDMTVPNEIDDAKAVIKWASKLPTTASISLLGHSQGGVVAAMTAGELGAKVIKSLVLMAPAAVLRDDALRGNTMGAVYDPWNVPEFVTLPFGLKLGHDYIVSARTLPIYETAEKYTGPTLIIHGTADRVVPYTYGERFHHDLPDATLRLMDGEDHGFSKNTPEAALIASDWLAKELLRK